MKDMFFIFYEEKGTTRKLKEVEDWAWRPEDRTSALNRNPYSMKVPFMTSESATTVYTEFRFNIQHALAVLLGDFASHKSGYAIGTAHVPGTSEDAWQFLLRYAERVGVRVEVKSMTKSGT